jgi:hypothetical protein
LLDLLLRRRFTAYVKNFTDEEYRLYDLDLGLLGFIEQPYAPPRQFGPRVTGSAAASCLDPAVAVHVRIR